MLFWLLAYLILRDGLLDLLMWSIRATYLLACYFTVRAIVRRFPRNVSQSAEPPNSQISMLSAYTEMHEHGRVWTRADYDAWLLAQQDTWLVIFSTSEEKHEQFQPPPLDYQSP